MVEDHVLNFIEDALLQICSDEGDEWDDMKLFDQILAYGTQIIFPHILSLFEADIPCVSYNAAYLLGRLKDVRAVDSLIDALAYHDLYIRFAAAIALGAIGDRRAVDPLYTVFVSNDITSVDSAVLRRFAARSLAALDDRRATDSLIADLSDPDPYIRGFAANALGEIRDKRALPQLELILDDPGRSTFGNGSNSLTAQTAIKKIIQHHLNPQYST